MTIESQSTPDVSQLTPAPLLLQLHNSNVQSACVQALRNDPAFQEILDNTEFQGSVDVPMHSFMPLSAQAAGITEVRRWHGSDLMKYIST